MRQAQAAAFATPESALEWFRTMLDGWNAGQRTPMTFAPFQSAVELYNSPTLGLEAVHERLDGEPRLSFERAVAAMAIGRVAGKRTERDLRSALSALFGEDLGDRRLFET